MTSRKLASAAAAASMAGVAVLFMSSPAAAACYPPPCTAGASDSTVVPGQSVTVDSGAGAFTPGSTVRVSLFNGSVIGTVTADASGNASFTFSVPAGTRPGRTSALFSGTLAGVANTVEVAFTVVAAAAASPGQGQGGSLADTGSDQLVPLSLAGVALVGAGAGMVVVARRRRETGIPAGVA